MDKQSAFRMNISSKQIAHQFNKHAESYNDHAVVQRSMAQMAANELQHYVEGAADLLEIGCGTGDLTALLVDRYPGARVIAVDIADQMIRVARRLVGTRPNVKFVVGDAEKIEWEDSFDAVISNAVIQWFRAPALTMTRLKRSLRRDGVMVHLTLGPQSFAPFFLMLDHIEADRGTPPSEHRLPLMSLEQWSILFESIEMAPVVMRSKVVDVEFVSTRAWLQSVRGTGAAINSGVTIGPACLQQAIRRYDDEHATKAGVNIPYEICTIVTRNEAHT